jgi:hypothetical protein
MAVKAAKEASWGLPPDGMDRIQSASFQKDRARHRAFLAWEEEFGLECCLTQFCLQWTGSSGKGHAHKEKIIVEPPSVTNHPLWSAATDVERDKHSRKIHHPLYSHHTTSAAVQLVINHAFTGSYTQCFCPSDPIESLACQCSMALCTPSHLIRECLQLLQAHINHGIHSHMCMLTLAQLHSSIPRAHQLLKFITKSKVAFCPPDFLPITPVPPEPD